MYATPSPHGSSASSPAATIPQHLAHSPGTQAAVGAPAAGVPHQVLPPAVHDGGSRGMVQNPAWNPAPAGMPVAPQLQPQQPAAPAQQPAVRPATTQWTTGAYELSGDPSIDRMIRLEAACKRFGSPI